MAFVPEFDGILRSHMIKVPEVISKASGIKIFGKKIRSIVFSTDVAIVKNINADAVMAVYPFTPQPIITKAIMIAADIPVFCGVGGGITTGHRVVELAMDAEFQGAIGVVVNAPTPNEVIEKLRSSIDIPVCVTIVSLKSDVESRIKAGANIINVSGAQYTPNIVREIRKKHPELAIMATGGPTEETILETIEAGANAITFTPKETPAYLFKEIMDRYRAEL